MNLPTLQEQIRYRMEAEEIKKSIIQKREPNVRITSINTQRFFVGETSSLMLYLVISCLLLFCKYIENNQINTALIIIGAILSLITYFIFGINITKLRQKQEARIIDKKHIIPILILSFVPYVYGLYLIIYVAILNLITFFSYIYIPQAIIYIIIGVLIIKKVKMLQTLGLRISENR